MSYVVEKTEREFLLRFVCAATPQGDNDIRIKLILKQKLANCITCSKENLPGNIISLGTSFSIINKQGEHHNLQIVLPAEANSKEGKISIFSDLGCAVYAQKVDDVLRIRSENQIQLVKIIKFTNVP